jgi:hypothetical protein
MNDVCLFSRVRKMGVFFARNKLQLVTPQEGAAGVRECNLIGAPPLPQPVFMPAPQPYPSPAPVPAPPLAPSS